MKWLKDNLLGLIMILILIIGFSVLIFGKKESVKPIIIDNSLNKEIENKIDSLLARRFETESNTTIINKKYELEKEKYSNIPDSLIHSYNVKLARELLSDSIEKRYIPRRK